MNYNYFLRIFSNLILLFSLLIGISFLPNFLFSSPTKITLILMFLILCLSIQHSYKILNRVSKWIFYDLVGVLSILSLLFFYISEFLISSNHGTYPLELFAGALFIFFVPYLCLLVTNKHYDDYIKYYIYFSLYVSLAGILAYVLVNFGGVFDDKWLISNEELSVINVEDGPELFPYYLGMVNVSAGQPKLEFMGIASYRASGLMTEPQIAAFFIGPSLFMLDRIFSGAAKFFSFLIILIFMIVAASATWMVLSIALFVLAVMLNKNQKLFYKFLILSLISICFFTLYFVDNLLYLNSNFENTKGLIYSKFVESSSIKHLLNYLFGALYSEEFLGKGFFIRGLNRTSADGNEIGIFSYLVLYFHLATIFLLCLRNFFSNSKQVIFSALALLYITIFQFRNLHAHYIWTPFYIYILYNASYTYCRYKLFTRSNDLGLGNFQLGEKKK